MVRRRVGEAVVVDGNVEIEIIEISKTRVKLGIRAPKSVTVERREVLGLAEENREASGLLAGMGHDNVAEIVKLFRGLSAGDPKV